jgi:cell division septum initiation protein DivIVA
VATHKQSPSPEHVPLQIRTRIEELEQTLQQSKDLLARLRELSAADAGPHGPAAEPEAAAAATESSSEPGRIAPSPAQRSPAQRSAAKASEVARLANDARSLPSAGA